MIRLSPHEQQIECELSLLLGHFERMANLKNDLPGEICYTDVNFLTRDIQNRPDDRYYPTL